MMTTVNDARGMSNVPSLNGEVALSIELSEVFYSCHVKQLRHRVLSLTQKATRNSSNQSEIL